MSSPVDEGRFKVLTLPKAPSHWTAFWGSIPFSHSQLTALLWGCVGLGPGTSTYWE
ncbi:hypothetical protein RAB80_008616 [Fusarium oxysporum f. sp. vasinfectum]|nr:hypothetical protein RAB80_008616 [Fusarium oxysporum f. sp. vasinfectum]KAK2933084.1 hypothetical protein FoTM2_007544 [Fusarium oxysporum f. sp. vasinfectum]WKT46545.1 hypothetical protein QSH57_011419 [Fusarium oxysporum f. sp. vasinfectum]